jgi:hypothetical protein
MPIPEPTLQPFQGKKPVLPSFAQVWAKLEFPAPKQHLEKPFLGKLQDHLLFKKSIENQTKLPKNSGSCEPLKFTPYIMTHSPKWKPLQTICNKCGKSETSKWYIDRLDNSGKNAKICKSCYTKRRRSSSFDGVEGIRKCTCCGSENTERWYQDQVSMSGYICMGCHVKRKQRF